VVGERLGIRDQFVGVDMLTVRPEGGFEVLERIEGGQYQVSVCAGAPAVLAWATGNLPEPPNNPQIGMANMRGVMPALQKAKPAAAGVGGMAYGDVELPSQKRQTRIVKDATADEIAREIVEWIKA